jgi:hypothetical protein
LQERVEWQSRGLCYYAMQFILGQGLDQVQRDLRRLRAGKESAASAVARALWTDQFVPADLAPSQGKATCAASSGIISTDCAMRICSRSRLTIP